VIKLATLLGLAGLALFTGLVVAEGVGGIFDALKVAGLGILWASLFHIVPMVINARAWQVVMPGAKRPSLLAFTGLVWMREAVNGLLPVARVGGEVVTARMMIWGGVRPGVAVGSLVVDMSMSIASQFLFTLIGLALLIHTSTDSALIQQTSLAVAVFVPMMAALFMAQRQGLFGLLGQVWRKLAGDSWTALIGNARRLDRRVAGIYRRRGAVISCTLWQLAGWIAGGGEIWLALHFLGSEISFLDALMIEALAQAVSSAAFLIPGALGVQEGGFLLFGALVGLTPEIALALALMRRARDLILFVPALLIWQWMEGKRLLRKPPAEAT
jgi:putative membrane protein